jgi:hypothetical protein
MKKATTVSTVIVLLVGSVAFGQGAIAQWENWSVGGATTLNWAGGPGPSIGSVPDSATGIQNTSTPWSAASQNFSTSLNVAASTASADNAAVNVTASAGGVGLTESLGLTGGLGGPLGPGQEQSVSAWDGTVTQFEGFAVGGSQDMDRSVGTGTGASTNILSLAAGQTANNVAGAAATQSAAFTGTQTASVGGAYWNTASALNTLDVLDARQEQSAVGSAGPVGESQDVLLVGTQNIASSGTAGTATATNTVSSLALTQTNVNNVMGAANESITLTGSQTATVANLGPYGGGTASTTMGADVDQVQQVN